MKGSLPVWEDTIYPQSCTHLDSNAFMCQVLPLYHLPGIGFEFMFAHRSWKMGCKQMSRVLGSTAAEVAQAARGYLS